MHGYSQNNDWLNADTRHYAAYLERDWLTVLTLGDSMLRGGYESAEVRLRIADAHIATGNYTTALRNLKRSYSIDRYNSYYYRQWRTANQLLYRREAARYYNAKYNPDSSRSFSLISNAGINGGIKHPDDNERSDLQFAKLFITTDLSYRISLYQSYQYYRQDLFYRDIFLNRQVTVPVKQSEYYLRINWQVTRDLKLMPAYQYVFTSPGDTSFAGNVFHLELKYDLASVILDGYSSYASLSNDTVMQSGLTATWLPLKRSGLYISASGEYLQHSSTSDEFVGGVAAGFSFIKRFWFEAAWLQGNLNNYLSGSGEELFNSPDITKQLLNTRLTYYINKNWSVHAGYQYELKEKYFFHNNYQQQSIITGITWQTGK